MSKFKKFLFLNLLFALFLFVIVGAIQASAFEDDFNDGEILDWTLVNSWSISNQNSFDGTNYTTSTASVSNPQGASVTNTLTKTGLSSDNFWFSISMRNNWSGPAAYNGNVGFRFLNNGTHYKEVAINYNGIISQGDFADYGGTLGTWYTIEFTLSSQNMNRKIYSISGTLLNDQTVSYTNIVNPDRVQFFVYAYGPGTGTYVTTGSFDNVIAAVSEEAGKENAIEWDAVDYIEGGTQTITWNVIDSVWDNWLPIKIVLYRNDIAYDVWSSCVLGICKDMSYKILQTQTGSTPLRLIDGLYRIDLIEDGIFSDTVLATDSMRVMGTVPSQMVVNSSIPSRVPTPIWHNVGYTYGTGQIRINIEHKRDGIWEMESATQISSSPAYTPVTVYDIGEYRFTLFDTFAGMSLVTKMATAHAVDLPIQINISNSTLTIDKSNYYYRDIMQGYYAIDNNNWTNGNTPYIAVRNTSDQTISAVFKNLLGREQQNTFMLVVGDGHELATNKFRPGNNTLELHSFNTTSDKLLDSVYFELSDTDVDGNKLRTSKYRYCSGEQVLILASTPLQSNLTIANYKAPTTILYTAIINGTDRSIIYKTNIIGDYIIVLRASDGRQLRTADFVIDGCIVATSTSTPPIPPSWGDTGTIGSEAYTVARLDNYVGTMGYGVNNTTRFMFSVIIIVLFIVLAALATKGNSQVAITCGFLPFAFFTVISFSEGARAVGIEFLPKWPAIMFIILVALAVKILR